MWTAVDTNQNELLSRASYTTRLYIFCWFLELLISVTILQFIFRRKLGIFILLKSNENVFFYNQIGHVAVPLSWGSHQNSLVTALGMHLTLQ